MYAETKDFWRSELIDRLLPRWEKKEDSARITLLVSRESTGWRLIV